MGGRLYVTNGDVAVAVLGAAGIADPVVPWRDVLHDGPVPGHLEPAPLREVRARFLAERGWAAYETVLRDLEARDAALDGLLLDEIVLVFEHDLYDQLQLLQVLDALALRGSGPSVTLACEADYVGSMGPERVRALLEARRSTTLEQLDLAVRAWEAFTATDPAVLPAFAGQDTSALPFLGAAVRRLLEERPAVADGLARSERQALQEIALGAGTIGEVYRRSHHDREDPMWLGDTTFAWYLERLSRVRVPLVTLATGAVIAAPRTEPEGQAFWKLTPILTDAGKDVLEGRLNHAALNGLDRWQGGVHFVQEGA